VRLIGVDTPETVDPRKTVECFGKEASNKAKELLTGKSVRIAADPTQDNRDKYNRLLRYVYLGDGTNFNKLMISEGYAHEYTYYVPYQLQSEFKAAQKDAERSEKGLWSPSTCAGDTSDSSSSTDKTSSSPSVSSTPPGPAPSGSNCNPNYTPCIPNVSYDLDCGDLSVSVRVIGTDVYRLDRDGDGYGCESN
jgi:micrococcal nuclease